jgi:hypothetical protein
MLVRLLPTARTTIRATSTDELFEPMTEWFHTLEAAERIRGMFNLSAKSGNFQCRLGIQTAPTSLDDVDAPTSVTEHSSQITTAATKTFIDFDPSGASSGNIDAKTYFRLGVLYSLSSGAVPSRGDVRLVGFCWR